MRFADEIERACQAVPGLVQSALVLMPEGLLIGGLGAKSALDHEPLVRAALHCLGSSEQAMVAGRPLGGFVEYAFIAADQIVVIQRARGDQRLALAAVCTRAPNLALVLGATRQAIGTLESTIDLGTGRTA